MWRKTAIISIGLAAACTVIFFLSTKTHSDIVSVKTETTSADRNGTERENRDTVRILFGGDMMFDRWIREKAMKRGNAFVFDGVREELRSHDMTVANLEGPVTDRPSTSMTSEIGSRDNYVFTFDPSWAGTLAEEAIGPVNLGNNHILNQEKSGIAQTQNFLSDAGVPFFGDPTSDDRTYTREISGISISFVSYDEFVPGGKERALSDIARVRNSVDVVILYAHWGSEYLPVRGDVRSLAHSFIDAGCDAIIGSHPHIVQEKEVYKDKTIYYSLGNFVFDQYLRDDTRKGLLVSMTIRPDTREVSFREIPITLRPDGSTVITE